MAKILVTDDDRNLRRVVRFELAEAGHEADEAASGEEALRLLERTEYDVLLLDLSMPGLGGMGVLQSLEAAEPSVEGIVLTAHATVSAAVEAMKLGAYDFLTKPFKLEELKAVLLKAVEKKRLRRENQVLRRQVGREAGEHRIVSRSAAMAELLETVARVAPSDLPVLVEGESGAGKELVARALHDASPRAAGPFVPLNCGAFSEALLESEIFGYERGAFTGAQARKLGLLEVAHGGTIFLDEIGEMPSALQVRLLRVVESGVFFRVGGVREVRVDVRCVSASNRDIRALAGAGGFRSDLYYRISAVTVRVPPLRERPEDVLPLIEHFVARSPGARGRRFSAEAQSALAAYPWPGNVRELRNVISRVLLLSRGETVEVEDLPGDLAAGAAEGGARLAEVEKAHIRKILREAGGHRGRAAERLGIDPKTLYRKLRAFGDAT